jgi:diguanylate cyclase (GGDEF)-like protein
MSKNNRVLALIALMFAASFGVGGIVFALTYSQGVDLAAATTRMTDLQTTANALSVDIHDEEAALDDHVLSRTAITLRRFAAAVDRETAALARLADAASGMPRVAAALLALEAASQDWRDQVATPTINAVAIGNSLQLDRFASQAAEDQAPVESAATELDRELSSAAEDLVRQQASVDVTKYLATGIAFAILVLAFGVALVVVRRFGHALELDSRQASVLNQFTEVTSFAVDDREVAEANLIALGRLARPDASVTHILNRSKDRAVPEASTGDAIAVILPLGALGRCAGVLRGTIYVADDLADELGVHCPIYPATTGTLACVPLISGESVGAVHLYWRQPNALPLERRPSIARITEHAALAIGNRRLMAALHGQANTDPRTGLANSRAFDLAVEAALAARAGHEAVSLLMLDVDHFKKFNDLHGHPAGDEALRAFGAVLRSCMREGDVAARYGGEEFAVLLPGHDAEVAATIAERIRGRTEATIIALAPGITDHITVSIGIATAPDQGLDRVTLLRVADEALYRAKATGRNRVVGDLEPRPPTVLHAADAGPTTDRRAPVTERPAPVGPISGRRRDRDVAKVLADS